MIMREFRLEDVAFVAGILDVTKLPRFNGE